MSIIVVASTDAGFATTGTWSTFGSTGYLGAGFQYDQTPGDTATFPVTLPQAGAYKVAITWVQNANRSTDAGVVVKDSSTSVITTTVDMTVIPADFTYNGSGFKWLSMSQLFASTSASVILTVPADGFNTIADAVYFELIASSPRKRRSGPSRSLRRIAANFLLPRPGRS